MKEKFCGKGPGQFHVFLFCHFPLLASPDCFQDLGAKEEEDENSEEEQDGAKEHDMPNDDDGAHGAASATVAVSPQDALLYST